MKWTRGGTARGDRGPSLRVRSVLLVLAAAIVLAYFGGWQMMSGRAARELARLRQQGEPLRPSELLPKFAPGEKNAADVYEKAFPTALTPAMSSLPTQGPARWTPAELAAAQAAIASNPRYFDLLARATRIEKCSFAIDWDDPAHTAPQTALLRHAAWALRAQAGVLAQRGDDEGALASAAALSRMAGHAQQLPSVVGSLIAGEIDGMLFIDLPFLLDAGQPSPPACRALSDDLAKQDSAKALVRGLQGTRAGVLRTFEAMEAGRDFSTVLAISDPPSRLEVQSLRAYPHVGKPVWYHDKAAYLEAMRDAIIAAGQPWPEIDREMAAIGGRFRGLGGKTSVLAGRFTSELEFLSSTRDRTAARLALARVALALKAYQSDHGQYPASLAALGTAKQPLPPDPFTGKALCYRRESSGFTLWSTGPDMVDSNGVPGGPGGPQRKPGGGYVGGCDCVMRCRK